MELTADVRAESENSEMWTGVHEKILLALEGNVAFFNNGISEANL